MLKQEKETAYKGGIMAFVHSCFTDRFSNLVQSDEMGLGLPQHLVKRVFPDNAV
jgi:hypothetical protein